MKVSSNSEKAGVALTILALDKQGSHRGKPANCSGKVDVRIPRLAAMALVVYSGNLSIGKCVAKGVNDGCHENINGISTEGVVATLENESGTLLTERKRLHLQISVHV